MKSSMKSLLTSALAIAVVGSIVYAFLPQPIPVDMAEVDRGQLQVTVDEDGKTRIKERYIVSSPLTGRLLRIKLDPGDDIRRGETLLARIEPTDPALLDSRALAEAEAKVNAAKATLDRAGPALKRAKIELEHAESEFGRLSQLHQKKAVSEHVLDAAEMTFRTKEEEYRAAKFAEEIARFELEMAKAALVRTRPVNATIDDDGEGRRVFEIRAPIDGRVLRLILESAKVVAAGTELLELGDPADLEVEIDVLSKDAVRIKPGQSVLLEQWGGEKPLQGVVRLVEPAGFTKISALGVEEQRVNVIIDFAGPPMARESLGDSFRVEARIIVWEGEGVLKVPISAMFRHQDEWAVFAVDDDTARLRQIRIGHRNGMEAEVLDGLNQGDVVIMHPSDRVADGVKVTARRNQ